MKPDDDDDWPMIEAEPGGVTEKSNQHLAYELIAKVPGLKVQVRTPCDCSYGVEGESHERFVSSVQDIIMHLNDQHQDDSPVAIKWRGATEPDAWTRERIADWLDTLDVLLTVDGDGRLFPDDVTYYEVVRETGSRVFADLDTAVAHTYRTVTSHMVTALVKCTGPVTEVLYRSEEDTPRLVREAMLDEFGFPNPHKKAAGRHNLSPALLTKAEVEVQAIKDMMDKAAPQFQEAADALATAFKPLVGEIQALMKSDFGQAMLAEMKKKESQ